jgi:hypothetical protein
MKNIFTIIFLCCCGVLGAQSYKVGDLYVAPDGSRGIVFFIHPDGSGGWVVALNDASSGCEWGDLTDVPELENRDYAYSQNLLSDTAGYTNTQIIRNYQNNNTTYAAGTVDFANGWVLPSPAQLSTLFSQLPFVTPAIVGAGGTPMSAEYYWSSAERNASSAWRISYSYGYFNNTSKSTLSGVRAVRSFRYTTVPGATYSWSNGANTPLVTVIPTQTTTYSVVVSNLDGSSSTVEHTIVVNSVAESQVFYDEVCQGAAYDGNGFSLAAEETATPGTFAHTRVEVVGDCPVTHFLELTVKPVVTASFEVTDCGSYKWNGQTYTESGDYVQTFSAANGCDSVVTMHLTLLPSPEAVVEATNDTICKGDGVTLQTDVTIISSRALLLVPPVAIGDILCTDNSIVKPADWPVEGKTAKGVVFFVDSTGEHGWAVHLQNQQASTFWGDTQMDIPDLPNHTGDNLPYDLDGYSNTQAIRAAGTIQTHPVGYAVDFDNGWYLPAVGQLRILISVIMFVNPSLSLVDGQSIPDDEYFQYWSSTESSATYAGLVQNDNGIFGRIKHSSGVSVRSICTF